MNFDFCNTEKLHLCHRFFIAFSFSSFSSVGSHIIGHSYSITTFRFSIFLEIVSQAFDLVPNCVIDAGVHLPNDNDNGDHYHHHQHNHHANLFNLSTIDTIASLHRTAIERRRREARNKTHLPTVDQETTQQAWLSQSQCHRQWTQGVTSTAFEESKISHRVVEE
jgi:hypothetical protein